MKLKNYRLQLLQQSSFFSFSSFFFLPLFIINYPGNFLLFPQIDSRRLLRQVAIIC